MYIRGLIPRIFKESAEAVPIEELLRVNLTLLHTNKQKHKSDCANSFDIRLLYSIIAILASIKISIVKQAPVPEQCESL